MDIIDTTCPLVTHIYRSGWKLQEKGLQLVIIGDPKHVEVKGIASRHEQPHHHLQARRPELVPKAAVWA